MPVNPVVTGIIQIVCKGTAAGIPWANVYNMQNGSTLDQALADTYAGLMNGVYANINADLHTSWEFTEIVATDLRTLGGPQFESNDTLPLAGTATVGIMPTETAALVSWTTAFRGAEGRGRTYLCGWDEGASDGNTIDAAALGKLANFIDDALAIGQMAVVSRYKGTEPATSGKSRLKPIPRVTNVTHSITAGAVDPIWRSQRRRQA